MFSELTTLVARQSGMITIAKGQNDGGLTNVFQRFWLDIEEFFSAPFDVSTSQEMFSEPAINLDATSNITQADNTSFATV
jgi:hypothetical protein